MFYFTAVIKPADVIISMGSPHQFKFFFYFRESNHTEEDSENYIITGGLDDLIKVWQLDNGRLEMKHQLEGHSLGVISVAVSPDGKSECFSKANLLFLAFGT